MKGDKSRILTFILILCCPLMRSVLVLFISFLSLSLSHGQTFSAFSVALNGGSGSSMVDYDGDGDLDIYVTLGNNNNNALLENDGLGNFVLVTTHPLIQQTNWDTQSSTWADFDNDGDLDVFMPTGGSGNVPIQYNLFFENLGGGNFTLASVGGPTGYQVKCNSTGTADYDNDGLLDILLCARDGQDSLFRNNGSLNFTSVNTPMDNISSWSTNTLFSDLDNDGDQDAIRIHRFTPSGIYENQNGAFVDVTPSSLSNLSNVRSVEAKDFDNDGDFDLLVGSRAFGYAMLQNNGGFSFSNVTSSYLPVHTQTANSSVSGDVDNDGDLDLYISSFLGASELWLNNGSGVFSTTASSANLQSTTDGPSMGDLNGDGLLDLYVPVWNNSNSYFINTTSNGNNYVQVELEGLVSNKSAIGAKVKIYFDLFGNQVWRVREVQAISQKQGQNDLKQHFGVGLATELDSLVIEWPSGLVCKYVDIPTNDSYYFQEVCCDSTVAPVITEEVDTTSNGISFQQDLPIDEFQYWIIEQQWCTNGDTNLIASINDTLVLTDTAQYTFFSVSLVYGSLCAGDSILVFSSSRDLQIQMENGPCSLAFTPPPGIDSSMVTWYINGQFQALGGNYEPQIDGDTSFVLSMVYTALNCTDTLTELIDYTVPQIDPDPAIQIIDDGCYTQIELELMEADLLEYYSPAGGELVSTNVLQFPFIEEGYPIDICYVFNEGADINGDYPCPNDTICETLFGTGIKEPLLIPNVFSPNGDGKFEELIIKNDCLGKVELSITNRWGKEVFRDFITPEGEVAWNGRIANTGADVPEGTYFYIVELDSKVYSTGTINLFR